MKTRLESLLCSTALTWQQSLPLGVSFTLDTLDSGAMFLICAHEDARSLFIMQHCTYLAAVFGAVSLRYRFHAGHANGQKYGHNAEITNNYDTCTLQEKFGETPLWIMLFGTATQHIPDIG